MYQYRTKIYYKNKVSLIVTLIIFHKQHVFTDTLRIVFYKGG